jgi:hypothetical protein
MPALFTMMAPSAYFEVQALEGTLYSADVQGLIVDVSPGDVASLQWNGCELIGVGSVGLLGRLLNVDMNSTADQLIPMFVDLSSFYRVTKVTAKNASLSMTTAAGGIYPAPSKAGTALVAHTSVNFNGLTSSSLVEDMTIATTPGKTEYPGTQTWYLSLTAAQGAVATLDLYLYGDLWK